ncbi:MAG: MFS transporter [bacterium]|jgi:sugar phosphate permease
MNKKAAQQMLSYRIIIFSILAVAYLLVTFHRMSTAVITQDLREVFAIDAAALGILGSMYTIPYALMQIPCGILSDTIGPRKLVTYSFIIAGAGAFLFGATPTFGGALIGRFLIGLGVASVYVPTLKILAVWFRKNEFATLTGILGGLGALGALIASAPLAFASELVGWRLVISTIGAATLVMAILSHLFVRNHPSEKGYPAIEEIDGAAAPATAAAERLPVFASLRMVFGNKYIWPLLIRGFMFAGAGLSLQSLWGGPFLMHVVKLDRVQTGSLLMMISIGSLITSPIGGYLSDKVIRSRKKLAVLSGILTVAGWIPLALLPDKMTPVLLYVLFLFMGVAGGLGLGSVGVAQVKELFPNALAGTATGVNNFFQMSGSAVFTVVLGMIINRYPAVNEVYPIVAYQTAFTYLLICVIIGTIAVSLSKETMTRETTGTTAALAGK